MISGNSSTRVPVAQWRPSIQSTSPKVQYGYASGSANTIRPTSLTYPNGRVVDYGYGAHRNGISDALSRIVNYKDGFDRPLLEYSYLGNSDVRHHRLSPNRKQSGPWWISPSAPTIPIQAISTVASTGSVESKTIAGTITDRPPIPTVSNTATIERAIESTEKTPSPPPPERNSTSCMSTTKSIVSSTWTEANSNGSKTGLTDTTFAQCWTLDETGNWNGFREDDNGEDAWDLIQSRTVNPVNEITAINETVGATWVTPVYSRAGNMTTMPKPADSKQSFTATYDAWNRLTEIADGATTVTTYKYDGAKRRTIQSTFTPGSPDETRHLYYTEPSKWQVLEERVVNSFGLQVTDRQFVWGLRYIDDLILRDRDTNGNGSLNEKLYALQDANWNVASLSNSSGVIQQRFAYSSYGVPLALSSSWGPQFDAFSWESSYAGYLHESATRLYNVRHRVFHPVISTWVQRDPLGIVVGTNLYQYANSSPLTLVDPFGLDCASVALPVTRTAIIAFPTLAALYYYLSAGVAAITPFGWTIIGIGVVGLTITILMSKSKTVPDVQTCDLSKCDPKKEESEPQKCWCCSYNSNGVWNGAQGAWGYCTYSDAIACLLAYPESTCCELDLGEGWVLPQQWQKAGNRCAGYFGFKWKFQFGGVTK
jgi:RHS repeat-associated protein